MLLSRKWTVNLGGNIQMDLSNATIPTMGGTFMILHRELMRRHHVEYTEDPGNEIICFQDNIGFYSVFVTDIAPQKGSDGIWMMSLDTTEDQSVEENLIHENRK